MNSNQVNLIGYIGHIASRHSELLADSNPVLTNEQAEALQNEAHAETPINPVPNVKEEPDVELEIPKSSVPNPLTTTVVRAPPRTVEKKPHRRRNTCGKISCLRNKLQNNLKWECRVPISRKKKKKLPLVPK